MQRVAGPANLLLNIQKTASRGHGRAWVFALGASLIVALAAAAMLVLP